MRISAVILGVLLSSPIVMAQEITGARLLVSAIMTIIGYVAVPIMVVVTLRSYAGWKESELETLKYLTYSFGLLTTGVAFHAVHNMIMLPTTESLARVGTVWHHILTAGGELFLFFSALMFLKSMRTAR